MESLQPCLTSFRRKLKEFGEMEVTKDEADAIVQRIVDFAGVGTNAPTGVALSPVHTYVHQVHKDPTVLSSSAIAVPPFACHWGIVVGPPKPESQRLFHLVFVEDQESEGHNSTVKNSRITFHDNPLYKPLLAAKYIGQTRYNTDQLRELGKAMIREFGNYHKVFWNCQIFAKCYLRVITGDHEADFDSWTSADTSRLFLCAFLVGTPFATTNKVKENVQAERLIKKIESIPEHLTTDDKSGQAISAIYEALKQDPSWGSEFGKLEDTSHRPGFWDQLLKILFRKEI